MQLYACIFPVNSMSSCKFQNIYPAWTCRYIAWKFQIYLSLSFDWYTYYRQSMKSKCRSTVKSLFYSEFRMNLYIIPMKSYGIYFILKNSMKNISKAVYPIYKYRYLKFHIHEQTFTKNASILVIFLRKIVLRHLIIIFRIK